MGLEPKTFRHWEYSRGRRWGKERIDFIHSKEKKPKKKEKKKRKKRRRGSFVSRSSSSSSLPLCFCLRVHKSYMMLTFNILVVCYVNEAAQTLPYLNPSWCIGYSCALYT